MLKLYKLYGAGSRSAERVIAIATTVAVIAATAGVGHNGRWRP